VEQVSVQKQKAHSTPVTKATKALKKTSVRHMCNNVRPVKKVDTLNLHLTLALNFT
jgi:hypothetical protein